MMPEYLDYGAIGLVALIAVGIFIVAREYVKRNDERERAREAARAEEARLERERREAQDRFMRQMIDQDRLERRAHIEAWQQMVEQDIEARQEMTGAFNDLCQTLNAGINGLAQDARERHGELLAAVEGK